jgi:Fe(3+) dicitrate transport protein
LKSAAQNSVSVDSTDFHQQPKHSAPNLATPTEAPIASDSSILELPEETVIRKQRSRLGLRRMRSVEGAGIYDGKKTEIIDADQLTSNTAANNARQAFARVPGVNVWESDGGGLQMGVGARGLSPKRTSEFNTRLNGYDLSADALGYPESYYTPPMEGLERIEVVRGAASLQYGTQFGGMINFAMKRGPTDRPVQLVSRQTTGSHGFFNSFNSLGGDLGPGNYYAFYHHKRGEDFRPNSAFSLDGAYFSQALEFSPRIRLTADLTVMRYLAQQPGGLTDRQFHDNPRQSLRSRNWFAVDWTLAAARLEIEPNDNALWDTRLFGLSAGRDALGFTEAPGRADLGGSRDLLKDDYRNVGIETRWLQRFLFWDRPAAALAGVRAYRGRLERRQGLGSDGVNADFEYENPDQLEGSEYQFPSQNHALFFEAVLPVSSTVNLTPGFRLEHIATEATGAYNGDVLHPLTDELLLEVDGNDHRDRSRWFPLFGLGASAYWQRGLEAYANISQNYRAINFNDMRVNNPNLRVDPALHDETGFNADLGLRGLAFGWLDYDVSLFYLSYSGRIGTVLSKDKELLNTFRYRTNISDSRNIGLESFGEIDFWKLWQGEQAKASVSAFVNATILDARYINSKEASIRNKKVELVPRLLSRTGLQWEWGPWRMAWQHSYTGDQFTEATNAEYTSDGINGLIPSYWVSDLSGKFTWKSLRLEAGCDNLTDETYFTRRSDGYPGPGVIPSPGRNLYATVGITL